MKLSCEKYLLQAAITVASRAAASKSPIQALEGLLLQAEGDLKITGYDLKEGIFTHVPADVAEAGSVVIGARFLGEMIRKLPDGVVTLSTDGGTSVKVKCGRSEFKFMGMSAEDYPEMPGVEGLNTLSLPEGTLRFKRGGGHGGHNGLRSINQAIGQEYARLKVGIGRPPGRMP